MILRMDHVSIATKNCRKAYEFFTGILGAIPGASGDDPALKYRWQILSLGDLTRLELIEPTARGSFLDGFLANKEGGVHHITLQTPDIEKAAEYLDSRGVPYFGRKEYGYFWKELFIHPRDAFGVLVQIAEFNAQDWLSPDVRLKENEPFRVRRHDDGCTITFAHPGGGTASIDLDRDDVEALKRELSK